MISAATRLRCARSSSEALSFLGLDLPEDDCSADTHKQVMFATTNEPVSVAGVGDNGLRVDGAERWRSGWCMGGRGEVRREREVEPST